MTRNVKVVISAEIGDLKAKLREGGSAVRSFAGELDKAARGGHLDAVAHQAAGAGVALTGMAAYAVKSAADFDKSMSAVAAASRDSSKSVAENAAAVKQLRAAAIQAGKDTAYSATEAAQGITELSKAGVSTADVLNGGLKGALALAAAGQISVAEAAETSASALTQFKLSGAQLPHVADLLAAAAGKAQGSVHDVGLALNQSGLIAAQFGLSIEDTVGVLAEFANAGLIGSDAGTSFKTMLGALANPSQQSREKMDELGVSFYDAQGKFIGLSGVAQVLQTRLKSLTDEQRQQTLSQLFGNDAIRAASILYTDGAEGVRKWRTEADQAGYSTETAAKLTDNLAGDLERLKGSLDTLAIQAGSGSNSGLRVLTKGLNALVNEFLSLPAPITSTLTVLAGLSGSALLVGAGWVKVRRTSALVRTELEALGPAGERAAGGMAKLSSAAGKAGVVLAALEAAGAVIHSFQNDLNPQVDALAVGLQNFAQTGQLAGEASRVLGGNLDDLKVGFAFLADGDNNRRQAVKHLQDGLEAIIPGLDGTNTSLTRTRERLASVDQALAQMVSGGNAQGAKQAFDALASQLAVNGVSMDEFRKQFPQYAAAVETAGSATKGATSKLGDLNSALDVGASAQDKYGTHAKAAAGAARGERGALVALTNELRSQTDPVFALITAQQGLKDAQANATKAVKEHKAGSKEAKAAQLDLAKAAITLQDAVGNLGGSFNGKLTPAMRDTLEAAGLTKGEIKGVEDQFKTAKKKGDDFARKYAAKVSADGAKQAKTDIDNAYTSANGFKGPYVAQLSVEGNTKVEAELRRLSQYQQALKSGKNVATFNALAKKAGGGPIYGPGTGTSDSIPAWVSNGEYVIKASSVQKLGVGRLDHINATGEMPAYAGGGFVTWPFPTDVSQTQIPKPALPPGGGAGPGGGQTYHWILDVVHKAFPGLHATSTFRKNSVTLSGNRSYHAVGRAVDFPPSRALAEWINANYFGATRELITPWNSLNIKNGARHRYTGEVFAQHAGTGRWKGNAHDHWAMANGGIIPEHVVGVGKSGRTYEFGEAGPERVTPMRGYASGGYVNVAPTAPAAAPSRGSRLDTYDAMLSAANAVAQLTAALRENGRVWSLATQKGRDNRSALISGIRAAQQAAQAKYAETGSVRAANKVYDDYLRQLDKSMKAMHVNAKTRRALIQAYSERPKYDLPDSPLRAPSNSANTVGMVSAQIGVEQALTSARSAFAWTKPSFNVKTATGQSELQELFSYLSAAQQYAQAVFDATGNSKTATTAYNGYLSSIKGVLLKSGLSPQRVNELIGRYGRITLQPKSNRWGGLYEHAATGTLRDAQIASGGPTRYAWAEPETGGEAFIPKYGSHEKSLATWRYVGTQWLGQQVGQGGPRHITVKATIPIQLGTETITRQVQFEVDAQLGKVVDAIVYQTAS